MNLGEYLKQATGPTLGTEREGSRYIDIGDLVADERNFYELSGIDALAANIELIGLQQPIRVRELSGNPGKFRIVSGHRRRAAIQKLVEEGREDLRSVHCIVETVECSEAMQELRLIYANSDTRKMSSAELSRQAERVEALLYQLKEEGFEFPGRMRDHVAQACQTTKSKLSRLKVIREKLQPMLLRDWEEGSLSDSLAYRIAREPEYIQGRIFSDHGHAPRNWTEEQAERAIDKIKNPPPSKPIDFSTLKDKEMAKDYLQIWAEENGCFFRNMKEHIFDHFIGGFTVIPTRKDGVDYLKAYCSGRGHWAAVHYDTHKTGLELYKDTRSREKIKRSWTEVWDAMACIALQKCAVEHNKPKAKEPEPVGQLVFNGWMPGGTNPAAPCDAVAVFDLGGRHVRRLCSWTGKHWAFDNVGVKIDMDAVKWMALPPDEEDA